MGRRASAPPSCARGIRNADTLGPSPSGPSPYPLPRGERVRRRLLQDDGRVRQVRVERQAGELLEGVDVALTGAVHHVWRQLGARVGLAPADLLAVVAHVLLVVRGLRPARRVLIGGPEAR